MNRFIRGCHRLYYYNLVTPGKRWHHQSRSSQDVFGKSWLTSRPTLQAGDKRLSSIHLSLYSHIFGQLRLVEPALPYTHCCSALSKLSSTLSLHSFLRYECSTSLEDKALLSFWIYAENIMFKGAAIFSS